MVFFMSELHCFERNERPCSCTECDGHSCCQSTSQAQEETHKVLTRLLYWIRPQGVPTRSEDVAGDRCAVPILHFHWQRGQSWSSSEAPTNGQDHDLGYLLTRTSQESPYETTHFIVDWLSASKQSLEADLLWSPQARFLAHVHAQYQERYVVFYFCFHRQGLIGDVFFHPDYDVEGDFRARTKANAMKLFRVQDDGSNQVEIKNEVWFDLAMDYVSVRLLILSDCDVGQHDPDLSEEPPAGWTKWPHGWSVYAHHCRCCPPRLCQPVIQHTDLGLCACIWLKHAPRNLFFRRSYLFANLRQRLQLALGCRARVWSAHSCKHCSVILQNHGQHLPLNCAPNRLAFQPTARIQWQADMVTLIERQATYKIVRIWCPIHQADLVMKTCINLLTGGLFY